MSRPRASANELRDFFNRCAFPASGPGLNDYLWSLYDLATREGINTTRASLARHFTLWRQYRSRRTA